ncbi:hypothetical protein FBEOM_12312 [Fusarium beomiforme]|uniref:Apple domain-containing protein n=1 Tax=Fusarium beomiforme TaxID=44412 RepID=A0A9P5A936_9HYPO|nr:hypothetical protein FBEOM_12312 [Fusarium beomiforme]
MNVSQFVRPGDSGAYFYDRACPGESTTTTSTVESSTTEASVTETSASEAITTFEISTVDDTTTTADASTTTSAAPRPECAIPGYAREQAYSSGTLSDTSFSACRNLCLGDSQCQAFEPSQSGNDICSLYKKPVAQLVNFDYNSSEYFYDRACLGP